MTDLGATGLRPNTLKLLIILMAAADGFAAGALLGHPWLGLIGGAILVALAGRTVASGPRLHAWTLFMTIPLGWVLEVGAAVLLRGALPRVLADWVFVGSMLAIIVMTALVAKLLPRLRLAVAAFGLLNVLIAWPIGILVAEMATGQRI